MFIHLLKRLYLIPFRKISRAKGNNRTDRHLLDSFSRLLLTPKQVYLISGQSFYKDSGVLKTVSNVSDGAFLGKQKMVFQLLTTPMVLTHYPRKVKYLKNIMKITLKQTCFFVIEGKICIINYKVASTLPLNIQAKAQ